MKKLVISCFILSVFTLSLKAQTVTQGIAKYEGDVNFTELANYCKTHPEKFKFKMPIEEEPDQIFKFDRPEPDASKVFYFVPEKTTGLPELPTTHAPNDTFQSTLTNGANIPPDTHGAVGSGNYVVTADNYQVKIQNRTGSLISAVTLDSWWGLSGSYDPRVHYDPYKNIWIMVVDYGGAGTGASKLWVAVSTTSNPTGTWHKYSITVDATNQQWLDFPNVGFNTNWVAIGGNMFTQTNDTPKGAVVYAINYANLISGTGATYTKFTQPNGFSICPALTYSPTEPSMFLMDIYNDHSGQARLWKISGSVTSPTMSAIGWPSCSTAWNSMSYANNMTPPYPGSDFAPQLGSTNKVQTNDERINNLVFRNNHLWTSHTVFLPYSATANPTRSSIMWWEVDTTGGVTQNCLIDDATGGHFFGFPSIAVNANNDVLIGFAVMSATTHPSAAYAMHPASDPSSTIRPYYIYRHGQASYFQNFGGPKNRWGDYSATCIDPSNDMDFWTNQESVATTNNWDTWWAQIKSTVVETKNVVKTTENSINIVPNPNKGSFDVVFTSPVIKPFNVRIADMQSRVVYSQQFASTQNNKVSVKTENLPTGIYVATIITEDATTTQKLEIAK